MPTPVRDLIAMAKAKPGIITYAVSGTGGINHFAGALFARTAGVRLVNVPYKGGPQALTDVIAGQVQIMIGTLAVSREAPVGFTAIRVRFALDTSATPDQLDTLLKLTERYCVVLQTLRNPPPIAATIVRR